MASFTRLLNMRVRKSIWNSKCFSSLVTASENNIHFKSVNSPVKDNAFGILSRFLNSISPSSFSKSCTSPNTREIHLSPSLLRGTEEVRESIPAEDSLSNQSTQHSPSIIEESLSSDALTPSRVVEILDRYIIGQSEAKKAVAVALRNRWRRHRIPSPMKEEIVPKNILMIGPTGCGKTEIARRLAKLADAPFVKVEATKFTEVGFHGRDVDQIIRDLVENAILLQRQKVRSRAANEVELLVENRLLELLAGHPATPTPYSEQKPQLQGDSSGLDARERQLKETLRSLLRQGALDNRRIQLEVSDANRGMGRMMPMGADGPGVSYALNDLIFKLEKVMKGQKPEKRDISIGEARELLTEMEMEKHMSAEQITKEAIQAVESDGIVFIDEIDKIVTSSDVPHGVDASSEGVQRDLLPIIEGSVVSSKWGNVATDHILFICSGAFHSCRPTDMLAELQGRLPIRVQLNPLTTQDLYRILTEPEGNMIRQQEMLMATENIELTFTPEAIQEIAAVAAEVNKSVDNIGARRLHTILERVVEEISFHAPERSGQKLVISKEDVQNSVGNLMQKADLSKFVL